VWSGFSVVATALQWALDRAGLLSEDMAAGDAILAGTVAIAAGIYQWTPPKQACLRHCRSPLDFLIEHWRPGTWGAITSGLRHGAFCVGCCWMLMALLFVGGVMHLLWVVALALLVLLEKTLPWGRGISRLAGLAMAAWGALVVAGVL
jgi:predicted metal-binding membrane protein